MSDDRERRSRHGTDNETWAPRKCFPAVATGLDIRLRRPSTGGGQLFSRSIPSSGQGMKRPVTAGAGGSQSMLFSGSLANVGRFGFRRPDPMQPIVSASCSGGQVRDGGSVRSGQKTNELLAAPIPLGVPRTLPECPEKAVGPAEVEAKTPEHGDDFDQEMNTDEEQEHFDSEALKEAITAMQSISGNLEDSFEKLHGRLSKKVRESSAFPSKGFALRII